MSRRCNEQCTYMRSLPRGSVGCANMKKDTRRRSCIIALPGDALRQCSRDCCVLRSQTRVANVSTDAAPHYPLQCTAQGPAAGAAATAGSAAATSAGWVTAAAGCSGPAGAAAAAAVTVPSGTFCSWLQPPHLSQRSQFLSLQLPPQPPLLQPPACQPPFCQESGPESAGLAADGSAAAAAAGSAAAGWVSSMRLLE